MEPLPAVDVDTIELPPPEPPWSTPGRMWFEVIWVTGFTILPAFLTSLRSFASATGTPHPRGFSLDVASFHVSSSLFWIVPAGIAILAAPEAPPTFGVRKPRWVQEFGLGVVGMLLFLASSWALSPLFQKLHWVSLAPLARPYITDPGDWGIYVPMAVLSCLGQEITCRAHLQTRLTDLMGVTAGILVSSALFSSFHLYQGFKGLTLTFVHGAILGVIRHRSGSVWPCFLTHFAWNVYAAAA